MKKEILRYILFLMVMFVTVVFIFWCNRKNEVNEGGFAVGTTDKLAKEEAKKIHTFTFEAAEELNENSNIFFELLSATKNSDKLHIMDAPEEAISDDGDIQGFYFPYPEGSTPRITQININSEQCDVFGIKIGDDINSVEDIMNTNGYIPSETDEGSRAYYESIDLSVTRYSKHDINIHFMVKQGEPNINEMFINVVDSSTPPDNVVH